MRDIILREMRDAERKAWEGLAGYKFWMFGYHAARWINYSRLLDERFPNPFRDTVGVARRKIEELEGQQTLTEQPRE
ncbi:hypothetical protein LCGC14_0745390 [marine sediment metagenome]|uniref:Uncharacterized protein n=1 Tax=marine sediment metagenome TaxID=412755 RepID=A0A0F9SQK1_9ZZZZ